MPEKLNTITKHANIENQIINATSIYISNACSSANTILHRLISRKYLMVKQRIQELEKVLPFEQNFLYSQIIINRQIGTKIGTQIVAQVVIPKLIDIMNENDEEILDYDLLISVYNICSAIDGDNIGKIVLADALQDHLSKRGSEIIKKHKDINAVLSVLNAHITISDIIKNPFDQSNAVFTAAVDTAFTVIVEEDDKDFVISNSLNAIIHDILQKESKILSDLGCSADIRTYITLQRCMAISAAKIFSKFSIKHTWHHDC